MHFETVCCNLLKTSQLEEQFVNHVDSLPRLRFVRNEISVVFFPDFI